ncbi:hypothetical protein [Burkholderia anthina]|uniref:hypothetical protein n=1 Tax=Burkholderia anthina TaxID=179879 RepID=UPI001FC83B61|nr:hypothetical protein [Burkholderia anthina]
MTLAIRVDWESGAICADRTRIEVGNDGRLSEDVLRLYSPVQISKNGTTRYRVSQQIAFGGHTGECLVDMAQGRLTSVAILFASSLRASRSRRSSGRSRSRPA